MAVDLLTAFQNVEEGDISSKAGTIQDNNNTLQGNFDSWAENTVKDWAMSYAKDTLETGQTTIDNDAHKKVDEACTKITKVCGMITDYKVKAEKLAGYRDYLNSYAGKKEKDLPADYYDIKGNYETGIKELETDYADITAEISS